MEKNQIKPLEKFIIILYRIEDSILVSLLLIMILMAVGQIFLRNLFETGIVWGDVLVRTLVLWIGMAGAMIASRDGNHIRIDLITRYIPERFKNYLNSLIELFTCIICFTVAWHSTRFVSMEYNDGTIAFASVPSWVCTIIIPISFLVIGIRYFILFYSSIRKKKNIPPAALN